MFISILFLYYSELADFQSWKSEDFFKMTIKTLLIQKYWHKKSKAVSL